MWKCGWFSWATACYTFFELCRNIAFIENGCKYMWHTRHTICLCSCSCSYSGWIECVAGLTGLLTSHPNTCIGMLLCLIHVSVCVLCAFVRSVGRLLAWMWFCWVFMNLSLCVCIINKYEVQKPARLFQFSLLDMFCECANSIPNSTGKCERAREISLLRKFSTFPCMCISVCVCADVLAMCHPNYPKRLCLRAFVDSVECSVQF